MDTHPMRWVIGAHRVTTSGFLRHVESREKAVTGVKAQTKKWLRTNPADAVHLKVQEPTEPAASSKVDLVPFSTTGFICTYANPYAQVWRCLAEHGTKAPIGRRRKDGTAPRQAEYRHRYNDCAVLISREPVRDSDGQVTVFSPAAAEELAADLFANAPEEEVISWKHGDTTVATTRRINVEFDPRHENDAEPFVLYIPEFRRNVYKDLTRPTYYDDEKPTFHTTQQRLDYEARIAERTKLDRQPAWSEEVLRFRAIWAAEEEAVRRERMMKGQTVL